MAVATNHDLGHWPLYGAAQGEVSCHMRGARSSDGTLVIIAGMGRPGQQDGPSLRYVHSLRGWRRDDPLHCRWLPPLPLPNPASSKSLNLLPSMLCILTDISMWRTICYDDGIHLRPLLINDNAHASVATMAA